jgi:superfamily II DNA or RNA helicase
MDILSLEKDNQMKLFNWKEPPPLRKSNFTLYDDQEISVEALSDKVRSGEKRIMFVGATGSGKTAISAELKRRLYPRRMLFVVHRDILISQTIKTLEKTGFSPATIGVVAGRYKENRSALIQILSIQTAPRRSLEWFDWEIAFFDEAHTTGWSRWALDLHHHHPDRQILYLTATPWRLSKKQSFTDIVKEENYIFAPLPVELIRRGRLVQPIYYKALEIKLTGVKRQGGDYKVSDLSVVCNNPDVISAGLKFWQRNYPGERTIAFAVDVSHAENVTKMANEAGRKAVLVHGETPIHEREAHYANLRDHAIDMIVSVDCLSEGFDVPNIRCAWMLRPTLSKAKFYQQLGRAMRVSPGKENCIILDQSGNINRHSFVEELTHEDFLDSTSKSTGDRIPPPICAERDLDTWDIIWDGEGCHAVVGSKTKACPLKLSMLTLTLARNSLSIL